MVSVNSLKIFFHCDIFKQNNYTVDSEKNRNFCHLFVYLLLNYFGIVLVAMVEVFICTKNFKAKIFQSRLSGLDGSLSWTDSGTQTSWLTSLKEPVSLDHTYLLCFLVLILTFLFAGTLRGRYEFLVCNVTSRHSSLCSKQQWMVCTFVSCGPH